MESNGNDEERCQSDEVIWTSTNRRLEVPDATESARARRDTLGKNARATTNARAKTNARAPMNETPSGNRQRENDRPHYTKMKATSGAMTTMAENHQQRAKTAANPNRRCCRGESR